MEQSPSRDQMKRYGRVVARAWSDESFRRRLQSDPAAVLTENGFHVPSGTEVRVVSRREAPDTDEVKYFVLPPKPEGAERLSDEALDRVASEHFCARDFACVPPPGGRP